MHCMIQVSWLIQHGRGQRVRITDFHIQNQLCHAELELAPITHVSQCNSLPRTAPPRSPPQGNDTRSTHSYLQVYSCCTPLLANHVLPYSVALK